MKRLLITLLLLGPVIIVAGENEVPKSSESENSIRAKNIVEVEELCYRATLKAERSHALSNDQIYFLYTTCINYLLDNKK